jgi:hypothetical protein
MRASPEPVSVVTAVATAYATQTLRNIGPASSRALGLNEAERSRLAKSRTKDVAANTPIAGSM